MAIEESSECHFHLALETIDIRGRSILLLNLLFHLPLYPPPQLVHQLLAAEGAGEGVALKAQNFCVSHGAFPINYQIFSPDKEELEAFSSLYDGAEVLGDYFGRGFHVDLRRVEEDNRIIGILLDPLVFSVVPLLNTTVTTLKYIKQNLSASLSSLSRISSKLAGICKP